MIFGLYDQNDTSALRKLWKSAFQDSDAYMDYYFSQVIKRNIVFAATEEHEVISMVHLNPYMLVCQGESIKVHYIVGVATALNFRRQGIMGKLLTEALSYLERQKEPFTYLMPARKEYYSGLGFEPYESGSLFSWKEYMTLYGIKAWSDFPDYHIIPLESVRTCQWEDFNRRLSAKYDLFAYRDYYYMKDLQLQCKSLAGDVYIVAEAEKIIAVMGIMYDGVTPECVQYLSEEESLKPMQFVVDRQLKRSLTEVEIFGNWLFRKYPLLQKKSGKGIMYKIFDHKFSDILNYDKLLMINEIV